MNKNLRHWLKFGFLMHVCIVAGVGGFAVKYANAQAPHTQAPHTQAPHTQAPRALSLHNNAEPNFKTAFNQLNSVINKETDGTPLLPVQLDFQQFLNQLKQQSTITHSHIKHWNEQLAQLNPTNVCEQIQHQTLQQQLALMQERSHLVGSGNNANKGDNNKRYNQKYNGSFYTMKNGQAWYKHWLKSWLQTSVSVDKLKSIAQAELKEVERIRANNTSSNQDVSGFASSAETQKPLANFLPNQHKEIVEQFRNRDFIINQHLTQLIDVQTSVPEVNITPSGLPKSFPAPGIYNNQTSTFLYHIQQARLAGKHMDWLYLHEGTPGHHFQHHVVRKEGICAPNQNIPIPMVSTEGWGAYVETLGHELGLFTHPSSYDYALEWRTLRALRVLIDVGIHAEGWSDHKAETLWMEYLPNIPRIMKREIARIKRWPVQSITYVYGKHLIEHSLRQHVNPQKHITAKQVRSLILKLSNQPPHALQFLPALLHSHSVD